MALPCVTQSISVVPVSCSASALKEVQKFYYDTAQGHHEGAMLALRQLIPTSQIMYGSDYPYRPGAETRTGLAERQFTQAERMAIDRGNALRLMPQLAPKA